MTFDMTRTRLKGFRFQYGEGVVRRFNGVYDRVKEG